MSDVLPEITRAFENALPSGTRATFTGEDVISLEIVAGLKADLIVLNLLGSLLVVFAAALMLRDMRMVLLVAIPSLFGGGKCLGAVGVAWLPDQCAQQCDPHFDLGAWHGGWGASCGTPKVK